MSKIDVRLATVVDAGDLADLATQLGYPTSPDRMEARLARVLDRSDEAAFVASNDGSAVGWIHVVSRSLLESEPFAEVAGLVVDERHRRAGVGGRLLAEAEGWAFRRQLTSIRVRSNVVRRDAHRFYLTAGYTLSKTQAVFSKPLST